MRCPACDHEHSATVDTRPKPKAIYRRRLCTGCGHRWTTYETMLKPGIINKMLDNLIDEMILKMKGRA